MARPRRPSPAADEPVVELARRLAALLQEQALTEIEVERAGVRVRLQRAPTLPAPAAPAPAPAAGVPAESLVVTDVPAPASLVPVESPMVGTFYRAPSPTAEPYVSEGDVVKEGQILCIIEAMKLMNEIESKVGGRVIKILVENGQAVEYGQPLLLIDPAVR